MTALALISSVMGLRDIKSRGGTYRARDRHVMVAQAYIRASPIADRTSSVRVL
jgi:hypothetical protein